LLLEDLGRPTCTMQDTRRVDLGSSF
jgi:hypothetical protein